MNTFHLKFLTSYPDINKVLSSLTQGIAQILGDNLVGIYLMGSLTYGDFNPNSSDMDLVTILIDPATPGELVAIAQLHKQIAQKYQKWAKRVECSYTPIAMLSSILPPEEPRPYYGEDIFYPEAPYGNEWIINQYLLYQHGVALIGPEFKELTKPINIIDVQKACIRDVFQEWQPKIADRDWLNNSHYQSYLILNLCRILYTVLCHETASKKVSATWVKNVYAPQWRDLIEAAENWQYGQQMTLQNSSIEFIQFVVEKISETSLYKDSQG